MKKYKKDFKGTTRVLLIYYMIASIWLISYARAGCSYSDHINDISNKTLRSEWNPVKLPWKYKTGSDYKYYLNAGGSWADFFEIKAGSPCTFSSCYGSLRYWWSSYGDYYVSSSWGDTSSGGEVFLKSNYQWSHSLKYFIKCRFHSYHSYYHYSIPLVVQTVC